MKTSCKERQKKFDALLARRSLGQRSEHHHAVNLSSKKLTPAQLQALSRGLNFAPSPQFVPKAHIVASVEAAITRSGACEEQATKARIGDIGALSHAKPPPKNTLPEERKAVKQLASDKNIIVLPADKGRAMVVMDREDYNTKIKEHLQTCGEGPYQRIGEEDEQHPFGSKTKGPTVRGNLPSPAQLCRQCSTPIRTTQGPQNRHTS